MKEGLRVYRRVFFLVLGVKKFGKVVWGDRYLRRDLKSEYKWLDEG